MNLRQLSVAAAGLGSAALAACGGQTIQVQPAAAARPASPAPAAAAAAAPVQATQLAQQAASGDCDAGAWTGVISPEGRPDGLDAGDAGAVYVWHEADGWHLRSTDRRPVDHDYSGTIRLAPLAASFTAVRTVRAEDHDRVWIDGTNVLHYDLHTFASIDGFDFRVSCPPGRHGERLAFHTDFDGHPIADRVRIGDEKRSPQSADFSFTRAA